MILYHGTNVEFDKIDLGKCKPFKDFGRGFYCTTIKKQAESMAKRVSDRLGGNPTILKFDLDEQIFLDKEIKLMKFEKISREWATFILNNRYKKFKDIHSKECNRDNKYDLVIGPVADDDILVSIDLFKDGFIDVDKLVEELTFKKLTNQYSFHTEKALKYLKGVN